VTGGCPLLVEKRFPNAGVAALLAARTWESRGLKAISSTRIATVGLPVAILACKDAEAVVAVEVTSKTLSVLLPSPP
jgi:hypothetical protein